MSIVLNGSTGITDADGGTVLSSADVATEAEAQAGSLDTKVITPLGVRNALNASGTAPIYACRAWVNFNGTGTVTIRAAGNVTSVTDVGTGNYTVNFTTAMPDTNYTFVGGNGDFSSGTALLYTSERAGRTAASVNIVTGFINTGAGAVQDNVTCMVAIFR